MEAVGLNGVADGIRMNAQFSGDGADLPMLGLKVTANLDVGFWADHLSSLDRGIRGKGSTKRPLRPQTMQHNQRSGRFWSQLCAPVMTALAIPVDPRAPHPHGAGELIETEP